MSIRSAFTSFAFVSILALSGCDNPNQGSPEAAAPEPNPAGESAPGTTTAGGRNSALGKAKDAAENTRDQVQQRNEELEKMMEDDG